MQALHRKVQGLEVLPPLQQLRGESGGLTVEVGACDWLPWGQAQCRQMHAARGMFLHLLAWSHASHAAAHKESPQGTVPHNRQRAGHSHCATLHRLYFILTRPIDCLSDTCTCLWYSWHTQQHLQHHHKPPCPTSPKPPACKAPRPLVLNSVQLGRWQEEEEEV